MSKSSSGLAPLAIVVLGLILVPGSFLHGQAAQAPSPAATPSNSVPAASQPAAAKSPAAVEVVSSGNQLRVRVPDQAPLSTVMSSVCQQQKIKCTGTDTLTSYRGPAMTVEGTLRQVISKLLEGTDVNYEFSRTSEGGATAIAFLGHAPRGTAPVPSPTAQDKPDHPPMPLHSRPFPGRPPQPGNSPEISPPSNPPQSQLRPGAPGSTGTADPASGPVQSIDNATAAKMLFTGTGDPTPAQYLPFPDQNGQPVPINNTPATAQPFPDQNGKPIPVKPTQPGSPFPTKPTTPTTDK